MRDTNAPEVTGEAVDHAESFDFVLDADNSAESMYIVYASDVSESQKQNVEDAFPNRLVRKDSPHPRDSAYWTDLGLSPAEDGEFEGYFLNPSH